MILILLSCPYSMIQPTADQLDLACKIDIGNKIDLIEKRAVVNTIHLVCYLIITEVLKQSFLMFLYVHLSPYFTRIARNNSFGQINYFRCVQWNGAMSCCYTGSITILLRTM